MTMAFLVYVSFVAFLYLADWLTRGSPRDSLDSPS
jgi:hypothetical protein